MKLRSVLFSLALAASFITAPMAFADGDHPMTEGVVKKINTATGKITIKHGPIVNLDTVSYTHLTLPTTPYV